MERRYYNLPPAFPLGSLESEMMLIRAIDVFCREPDLEYSLTSGSKIAKDSAFSKKTASKVIKNSSVNYSVDNFLSFEDMCKTHINSALKLSNGKVGGKGGAAEILQINPATLRSRIKKLGIKITRHTTHTISFD